MSSEASRSKSIVRTSILGIAANVALAAFKAVIGILSHSIAITLDAVNNLSDAASSVITILGTKLASKAPDREHPYGHGRYEYLTTMVVAGIVLWAGLTSLWEAVQSILHPATPDYTTVGLVIIAVAVVVKIVLSQFFIRKGTELHSGSLRASGEDARFDAIISASTIAAAAIYIVLGISLEAWLGVAISLVIVKGGVDILREALNKVLGERVDSELAHNIKTTVCTVEGVRGAYDLILNDYGPERLSGSVHVEVDETISARDVDRITRQIQEQVFDEYKVVLHTIGIYSTNTAEDSDARSIHAALQQIAQESPHVLQVHGLYVDADAQKATFDLVVSFEAPDRDAVRKNVLEEMRRRFPGYVFMIVLDSDISD